MPDEFYSLKPPTTKEPKECHGLRQVDRKSKICLHPLS